MSGDIVAYSCEVKYHGRWAPEMECTVNGVVVEANNESSRNIAKYTYITELTPADNRHMFICRIYFDQPQPGTVGDREANNIPTTDNVLTDCTMPDITVYCKY